jgi:phosphatidylglycerophosphatase A
METTDTLPLAAPPRPDTRFLLAHPAHLIALGFGSGLSRVAPGTAGTVWAWLAFALGSLWLDDAGWGMVLLLGLPLGWWACTVAARHLQVADPSAVVWDEILAFWLVLWVMGPASLWGQLVAFALFRFFDAVKPGPVGWADRLFHDADPATDRHAWAKAGWGIMFDDLVAAACALLVLALWKFVHGA